MSVSTTDENGRLVLVDSTVAFNRSMQKVEEGAKKLTCTNVIAMIVAGGFFWGMIMTALCAADDCYRKESLNCQVGGLNSCDNIKYVSIACLIIGGLVAVITCTVWMRGGCK